MRRHQRRENSSIGSHKVTFPAPIATSQGAYRLSNSPVAARRPASHLVRWSIPVSEGSCDLVKVTRPELRVERGIPRT